MLRSRPNAGVGIATRLALCLGLFAILSTPALAQEAKASGNLRGQVTDPSGAVVVGAAVSVATADGQTLKALSDKEGVYVFRGLPKGNVTLSVSAAGFAAYQMPNVIISAGETQEFDVALGIAVKQEQVTVESEGGGVTVDVNPENNASATILKGEDLEALPDDPDELQQDLLALAGPSVGPNGGQIYIDGFSNGTLPPKSSIREIRINQNPFSAEYDKPGHGRVEVFTKPGSAQWHGLASFYGNNSVFNSRNPYVLGPVPPYHSEIYNGYVSGALSKKLSIFLNAERRNINELAAVAQTPFTPLGESVPSPRTLTNVSTRFDYQLTPSNTLIVRYQFLENDQQNLGIGGLTLAQRGYSSNETEQTVQISDTQIVNPHVINETHFQFLRTDTSETANQGGAALNVPGEFNGGGSTYGLSRKTINRYELQNHTSWATGRHFVKFGGRLRVSHDDSLAVVNGNGTLIYSGTPCVRTVSGCVGGLTPLQAYENGTPSQASIVNLVPGKNGRVLLSFADVGLYAQDDWKLRNNLTLSYGLRFESQSDISDKADFAPRVTVSWGLGSGKSTPKTVLRFGYGMFYDRFTEDLVLQVETLNGEIEQPTIVSVTQPGPIQCPVGTPPGATQPGTILISDCSITAVPLSPTVYQINPNLRAPYAMQSAVSLERQLGSFGTLSLTYLNSVGEHQLILVNVNAPCALGSRPSASCAPGERPLGGNDNIYQYNSEAIFRQNQLIANMQIRVLKKFSLTGYYVLNFANSDTGGPSSSPSNQYNLLQDYGRASFDVRQKLFLSGSVSLAHNIRISPFVIIQSGAPFNITTGQDNGDTFFNQRPSFGIPGAPGVITTPYGSFNPNPASDVRPIPINYGSGPASATVNVRLSKTFGFGPDSKTGMAGANPDQGPGGPGGGHGGGGHGGPPGGGFGGPRGMGGIFGTSNNPRRYNLTLTMTARNIFNTWNPGPPIGNLSSSNFGQSVSLAGGPFSSGTANRRVDFQALFSF